MKSIYILRGVSGSGRSTLAKNLINSLDNKYIGTICEADEFFIKDGEYKFYPEGLVQAHNYCRRKFDSAIINEHNLIVISNTNASEKEFAYYLDKGRANGYYVAVIVTENRHNGKNLHGVPLSTLLRQEEKLKASLKLR